jgi:pimeloyl-ACP methyl ester carboxylesterase
MRFIFRLVFFVLAIAVIGIVIFNIQRGARESQVAADVAPRNGRFVDAGDVRMLVQESGPANAPAVMLVHGTGTWSEIWRETIDALSADYHVIAVDLPPFGYSEKPLHASAYTREKQAARLIHVIDALHLQHVTLVGHSVGARPVVEAALRAPGRFSRLILVDPALGFKANSDPVQFEQNHPSDLVRKIFENPLARTALISSYGTNPLFMKQMFSTFVSKKDAVTQHRLDVIEKPMVVKDTTAAYGAWLSMLTVARDESLSSDFANLRNLKMPVQIIWGSTDTVTPIWQGNKLEALIPHAKLYVIEGVGHIPYIEDPPRFIAALRAALRS